MHETVCLLLEAEVEHAAGKAETVAVLIASGADVDALDANKRTPLFVACDSKSDAVAECLVSAGARRSVLGGAWLMVYIWFRCWRQYCG